MNNNTSIFKANSSSAFVHCLYSPSRNDGNVLPCFHRKLVSPSSENTNFSIYTNTPPNDIAVSPDRAPLQSMPLQQIHPTTPLVFRLERSPRKTSLKNHSDIKRARLGEKHISPVLHLFKKKQVCTIDKDMFASLSFEAQATPDTLVGDLHMVTPPSSPTRELSEVPTHRRTTLPMIGIIDDYQMLVNHNHRNKQRRGRNHALCSSEFDLILDQVFAHAEAN
jgi:hypothetical protein